MVSVATFVDNVQLFFLVFMRMGAIFVETPFIGSNMIPMRIRGAVAFMTSLIIFPPLAMGNHYIADDAWQLGYAVANEVVIGLMIGFIANCFFMVFQLAGQFFSVQIGFGIINVMDPVSEISVPIIGQLQSLFATLIFIGIDGHRFLLEAVYRSYEVVPLVSLRSAGSLVTLLTEQFGQLFEIAFFLAAPIMGTIFIIEVSMGIMTKSAPQMNVMMLGFPIKIMVGMMVLMILLPQIGNITEEIFQMMNRAFGHVLLVMQ